jgi:tetratricopeptide (TPR) repeat protein
MAAQAASKSGEDRSASLSVWVRALAWQSSIERAMGQRDVALQSQQQCLVILEDPILVDADTRLERATLSMFMRLTEFMVDYALGRELFEKSFFLFHGLDHSWGMAWALNTWGTMSMFLGDLEDARLRHEEALSIYQTLGNHAGITACLSRLAEIAMVEGRFEEAECLARESVGTACEGGIRTELAYALLSLGEVLEEVGKFAEALSVLRQSLELHRFGARQLCHRDAPVPG